MSNEILRTIVPMIRRGEPVALTSLLFCLPNNVQDEVRERTVRINKAHKAISRSAIETGRDLEWVKSNIGHGHFETYVAECIDVGKRMAEKYMTIARIFEDRIEQVEHLPLTVLEELARQKDEALTSQVLAAYEKGRKLADYDVIALARSMARHDGKAADVDIPTTVDTILDLVRNDRAEALVTFQTIKSLGLLPHTKRLRRSDLEELCRRLQNLTTREKNRATRAMAEEVRP